MALNMDFTLGLYRYLLDSLIQCGYSIVTVDQYVRMQKVNPDQKIVILRHDIDRMLHKASIFADIETEYGIKSTYYFRSFALKSPEVILYVSSKGHEIGYHYEVMSRSGGDPVVAKELFEDDLMSFRSLTPIYTVCMHGAPLSKFHNLSFWDYYQLGDFNLIGEAFLTISGFEYFSDTGRTWLLKNKIRDFLPGGIIKPSAKTVAHTRDLINYIQLNQPLLLYILAHPERWSGTCAEWTILSSYDLCTNLGKKMISIIRG